MAGFIPLVREFGEFIPIVAAATTASAAYGQLNPYPYDDTYSGESGEGQVIGHFGSTTTTGTSSNRLIMMPQPTSTEQAVITGVARSRRTTNMGSMMNPRPNVYKPMGGLDDDFACFSDTGDVFESLKFRYHGKYGGPNYSAGKFLSKGDKVNYFVSPDDPLDDAFRKHDYDYETMDHNKADRLFIKRSKNLPSSFKNNLARYGFRFKAGEFKSFPDVVDDIVYPFQSYGATHLGNAPSVPKIKNNDNNYYATSTQTRWPQRRRKKRRSKRRNGFFESGSFGP